MTNVVIVPQETLGEDVFLHILPHPNKPGESLVAVPDREMAEIAREMLGETDH